MPVAIIVAYDENKGIGLVGNLPWHFREDLQYFKAQTLNQKMLMGYETYQTLPIRPLPNRTTIVATRNHVIADQGVLTTVDVEATLDVYAKSDEWLLVAGGSCIYEYALKYAKKLLITKIPGKYEVDTYFPEWDEQAFTCVKHTQGEQVCFEEYERKSGN
ncbi:MAG: dihydrofolate reductase [Culicoidibacterales bacterium]